MKTPQRLRDTSISAPSQTRSEGISTAQRTRCTSCSHHAMPTPIRTGPMTIDDLVTRGVDEPYRLFTSRSEYRLLLRQDNALRRLYPLATRLHLLSPEERRAAESRLAAEDQVLKLAESSPVSPGKANNVLTKLGSTSIREPVRIADLARRPEVPLSDLLTAIGLDIDSEAVAWANIELKYSGYMAKERSAAGRVASMEHFEIPSGLEYQTIGSLSTEAREKLSAVRPKSLGQASRIPGVSPSDIQNLIGAVLRLRTIRLKVSRETGISPLKASRDTGDLS